ncbi:MAG: IS4 family transposase [Acidobacteria bacterium]|nr:MAG: IS4 family transposase [Acidobacteriota bacterium]
MSTSWTGCLSNREPFTSSIELIWTSVRLHRIHRAPAFFITRARRNFRFRRLYSHRVESATGVICDQTIRLQSFYPLRGYPDHLRRIRYQDLQHPQRLIFLTNNFLLPASQIARLYQCRWQIELFFKRIKQHLRIKAFFGISENAVKTQIWVAIRLCLGRHRQKTVASGYQALRDSTGLERVPF